MEINNLGFLNMNDYRMTAMNGVNDPLQNFDEIMRKANSVVHAGTSSLQSPIDKNDELYKLCLELETFIMKNLLTGMRNTVQKTGLIDDSYAGKIYEDMLWDEYAKDFTKNANLGLAEQAYRQLKNYY